MRTRSMIQILLAVSSLLLLAACGQNPPQTVEITLTEFGIDTPVTIFQAGQQYRFVITNAGALNHEFTIMPPMASPPADMHMDGHSMEHMTGAIVHIGEDELTPGATVTLNFTFSEPTLMGDIEFACHLPGHYEGGMVAPIRVES
jgi:uncharacterized cupredoxin-like copper-binding protein